ncbi:MAG: hypothetical protein Q8N39_09220 [Pelolinea sp.]|nr:hypothetical protein [Pelolinea sp.]
MKKLHKSLKGLFLVNAQAGYLRLILTIILIFILWSLLAIISTVYNPLGKLNPILIPNFNSTSLALSLIRDILKAYLAVFTISSLLLIIFIFWLSFTTIAAFCSKINIYPSIKANKDYLSNCAFSIPGIKKYRYPNSDFINSEDEKSFSFPEGPLKASIKPKFVLFVSNRGIHKSWVNSSDYDDLEVSLEHQDKIIDCFNIEPTNLQVILENRKKDSFQSPRIKIELVYFFQLPVTQENINHTPILNLFEYCDSKNIQSIIEKVIISEVKATLTQFSLISKDPIFFQHTQSFKNKRRPEKKSNKTQFGHKTDAFSVSFIQNPEKQVIKRNRKRPMYLTHRLYSNNDSDKEDNKITPSLIKSINELLTLNIRGTMINLFSSEIIEAKIIAFGEQEIK